MGCCFSVFSGVPICNGGSFVCLWAFENRGMNSPVLDVYGSVEEFCGCVGNFVSEFYRWVFFVNPSFTKPFGTHVDLLPRGVERTPHSYLRNRCSHA